MKYDEGFGRGWELRTGSSSKLSDLSDLYESNVRFHVMKKDGNGASCNVCKMIVSSKVGNTCDMLKHGLKFLYARVPPSGTSITEDVILHYKNISATQAAFLRKKA